jgi:hypothetical protein
LPFRHFEFQRGTAEILRRRSRTRLSLLEDRVLPAAPAGSKPPQMASVHSTWTPNERIRQVIEARRHLGQQVMEMVFLSREPLSPADAESHLGAAVRDVAVLREPEKL